LSVICYLNDQWKTEDRGSLLLYLPDGPLDILPISGRLVCFRSDQIEHEVQPATRERLSLTGWLLDQEISLNIR
jgi:SM-20-related protein